MTNTNIEIKARINNTADIRAFLENNQAEFTGLDHQIDTYFNASIGRLKIREGDIEACIVQYNRPDNTGPKRCDYTIEKFTPGDPFLKRMKLILSNSLGILAIVDKYREIYFIGNIKFHLDRVEGLGEYFEIEAIGDEKHSDHDLRSQCDYYLSRLGITDDQLVRESYSDLVLKK